LKSDDGGRCEFKISAAPESRGGAERNDLLTIYGASTPEYHRQQQLPHPSMLCIGSRHVCVLAIAHKDKLNYDNLDEDLSERILSDWFEITGGQDT